MDNDARLHFVLLGAPIAKDFFWPAAADVAEIASVPDERRAVFSSKFIELLGLTIGRLSGQNLHRHFGNPLKEVEEAANALFSAFRKLEKNNKPFHDFFMSYYLREVYYRMVYDEPAPIDPPPGSEEYERMKVIPVMTIRAVKALAAASAQLANKSSLRIGAKGNLQTPTLQWFVRTLWRTADRHGGELSANCKNNVATGSMYKALERLRPTFEVMFKGLGKELEGFIKPVLQAQTIAKAVAAERKRGRKAGT